MFTLSVFADEIAADLETQVQHMRKMQVNYLEFRSAWGVNVKDMDDDQIAEVHQTCENNGIAVSCIGSPIGKSPVTAPLENEIKNLERIFKVCDILGTRHIRMFSFYPPAETPQADYDSYLDLSIVRLSRLSEMAERAGCTLVMENDLELVGDTVERCKTILDAVDNPHLRHAWDPGNFVLAGVEQPTTRGWEQLESYLGYVHIKDARRADRSWRAAGEGDAQIPELLQAVRRSDYRGMLAVEPHPFSVDGRGKLEGAEGTGYAVSALRKVLANLGYDETGDFSKS